MNKIMSLNKCNYSQQPKSMAMLSKSSNWTWSFFLSMTLRFQISNEVSGFGGKQYLSGVLSFQNLYRLLLWLSAKDSITTRDVK